MKLIGYVVRNSEGKYFLEYQSDASGGWIEVRALWTEIRPAVMCEEDADVTAREVGAKSLPVYILE